MLKDKVKTKRLGLNRLIKNKMLSLSFLEMAEEPFTLDRLQW